MKFGYLILAICFAFAAACSPEARPDEYGKAMPGTGGGQGDAGAVTAGRGGSGGSSVVMSGGTGGSVPMGGMAGGINMGNTGGAAGASMSGGTAGMNTGGSVTATGGTPPPPPPPPGPIEKPTSPVLFAGTSDAVSKVVSGDAMPGYFYVVRPASTDGTVTKEMLAAADRTGLPAGVTFALQTSNTAPAGGGLFMIFGFNFRANDAMKWRWIDASDYAGITFWARAAKGAPTGVSATTVDGSNVLATDPSMGKCAAAPCVPVHGKEFMPTSTWTQFKFKWTDFVLDPVAVPQGPVDPKQMGRIDLLQVVPDGSTVDFQITAVKLATSAELL